MAGADVWTGIIAGSAAISGVVVTTLADSLKERRKIRYDLLVKERDREQASAARRRTFEIENLQVAYDSLWFLARQSMKIHMADVFAARNTEHGYGGTLLPEGVESDVSLTSKAAKAILLILDDEARELAREAQAQMTELSLLGSKAKAMGRGPVSEGEAEILHARVADVTDRALKAIAARLRAVVSED